MSLITRCPACTTLFRVVPDQLRVSEGWVRCGQCDEVFDANVHLQSEPGKPASLSTSAPISQLATVRPEQTVDEADDSGPTTSPEFMDHLQPAPSFEATPEYDLAVQLDWPGVSEFERDPLLCVRPGKSPAADPSLYLELPGDVPVYEEFAQPPEAVDVSSKWSPPLYSAASVLNSPVAGILGSVAPEVQAHKVRPSFSRNAQSPSVWTRPWLRWVLSALSLGLMLGLALQVVLHERDRLAASISDLRPALLTMCEAFNCKIAPYRQIDFVVIENSAFVKVRGDVYRLSITLKNTAPIDIAAPAVELTLTDLQEQPMIRHVLSAADLGASTSGLVAGGDLTLAIPVHVKTASPSDRISGYRLLAFYP
ncbi:MAG: zinc-ribbon domain-containing protein [Candidatus Saccharibacteria bacterium]|nr:zinc-ribbon domain-containing protein [Rhodoferax sp.]